MKLPDGVVRKIYKKVEEQWLIEHKERFSESLDMLGGMCMRYQKYRNMVDMEYEMWKIEIVTDEYVSEFCDEFPSFVLYFTNVMIGGDEGDDWGSDMSSDGD